MRKHGLIMLLVVGLLVAMPAVADGLGPSNEVIYSFEILGTETTPNVLGAPGMFILAPPSIYAALSAVANSASVVVFIPIMIITGNESVLSIEEVSGVCRGSLSCQM